MPDTKKDVVPHATEEAVPVMVNFTNGKDEREAFYLKLLKSSMDDELLSDLRTNIAGVTGSIEISHFPFCGRKGAIVPDSFTVQEYLTDCLGINIDTTTTFSVYMRDESVAAPTSLYGNADVSSVLDADKLARIKGQVNDVAFKQLTGTAAKYIPELEEQDWAVVNGGNALCHGIRLIREKPVPTNGTPAATTTDPRGIPVGLETARYPAFRLKQRTIISDSLPNSAVKGVKLSLRIPEYIIDDKSYVSVYETETDMQSSMASSSFSETDVAAAASGSYMGFSGSFSASLAVASSQAGTSTLARKSKKVTIAYNFPRATVFLDDRSLELTPECEDALRLVKDKESLQKFQNDYGEFFSTRVQLGGRLFATEDVTATASGSSSEKARSMKVAAAASFSGWGASGSVSASHGQGSNSSEQKSGSSSSSGLTWQANGGDTLLCTQPLEWASTVSYHWNWRTTKQDKVVGILDIISLVPGMEWLVPQATAWGTPIDQTIHESQSQVATEPVKSTNVFSLNLKGNDNGRYLLSFPNSACDLSKVANAHKASGKGALYIDAEMTNRGCSMLGPTTVENREDLRLYEVEDAQGNAVAEVQYGTKYFLRNRGSGLYLDYHSHYYSTKRFVYSCPTRAGSYMVSFHNEARGVSTDKIPDGAVVWIRFHQLNNKGALGYMYVSVTDNKYAYLFASEKSANDKDEAMLTLTYK